MTVRRRRAEAEAVVVVVVGGGRSSVFASPLPFVSFSSGPFFPPLSPLSPVEPFFSAFFSRHQVVSLGRMARPVESLMLVSCAFEFGVNFISQHIQG